MRKTRAKSGSLPSATGASAGGGRREVGDRNIEPRLVFLLDALPGCVAYVDPQQRYRFTNRAYQEWFGCSRAQMVGRNVREAVGEAAYAHIRPHLEAALGGKAGCYEEGIPLQNGETRWLRVRYVPDLDSSGRVLGALAFVDDVSTRKQAEENWRAQSRMLQLILDSMGDGVIAVDANWAPSLVNAAALRILRRGPGSQSLPEWAKQYGVYLGDKLTRCPAENFPLVRAMRGEGTHTLETFVRREGEVEGKWVSTRAWPILDEQGTQTGAVAIFRDITEQRLAQDELRTLTAELERRVRERTAELERVNAQLRGEIAERRQAQENLQRTQQQLQDIIDHSPALIYLKDLSGRYVAGSKQAEAVFGIPKEGIIGQTDAVFFPPAIVETLRANDQKVIAAKQPLQFEEMVPQDNGIHTYLSVKFPLCGAGGEPYGVGGVSTDITAQKQVEAELIESRAELLSLLENTGGAVWSVDRDYNLIASNTLARSWHQQVLGRDLKPGPLFDVPLPDGMHEVWKPLYDRVLAGESFAIEHAQKFGDEDRYFRVSFNPITGDGTVTGATVFAQDVTDSVRTAEEARRHHAELSHALRVNTLGEMVASISHDIGQPLTAIGNYVAVGQKHVGSGQLNRAELLRVLDLIEGQASRAGRIIESLWRMMEKRGPQIRPIDITEIAREVTALMEPEARRHRVVIRLEMAAELPPVRGDSIQLGQVLMNLFLNSIEAMRDCAERQLLVEAATNHSETMRVTIRDTGSGLPKAAREKLFVPFFTTKPQGLGMGLAISDRIISSHGGRLWATPNPGGGAAFHFTLPLAEPDPPSPAEDKGDSV